ncbi:MAG: hypothetical protein ABI543_05460 [Ignavibacteria bacterium]
MKEKNKIRATDSFLGKLIIKIQEQQVSSGVEANSAGRHLSIENFFGNTFHSKVSFYLKNRDFSSLIAKHS